MTAAALWTAVKDRYSPPTLRSLTNIDDRTSTAIDDTAGEQAAQTVLNLWPVYAQVAYDANDNLHVEVGTFAVLAVLWRRGGTATEIERVKWDEVFGADGMLQKVKRTDPRGRQGPSSNSTIRTSADDANSYSWSDRASLPPNFLPRRGNVSQSRDSFVY